jgi:subtilase family serine protease
MYRLVKSSAMAAVVAGLTCLGLAPTSSAQTFDYITNPPHVQVQPDTTTPAIHFGCETTQRCYRPSAIRTAYNFPSSLDGSGQTILIVDAFGSPSIQQDLATFDTDFGIAAPPSFSILCPEKGCPVFDPNDTYHAEVNWTVETSLDVEYAHAMAPGAKIVLVVASTSSGDAINAAEAAAIKKFPGAIMSQSFGIPELVVRGDNAQIAQAHRNYVAATAAGITLLASAGDSGATNGVSATIANAGFPASDPLVTAVGGTEGNPYFSGLLVNGSYGAEQVWNEPSKTFPAATGGAPSRFFSVPSYQNGLGLQSRTVPDVAYNAAGNGGVLVLDSTLGGFFLVGGTSCGSPQWAAIMALANQAAGHPLGFVNPAIYKVAESSAYAADFHDITTGDNKLNETETGFSAGSGYDFATGWGTPNVSNLIPDLVKAASTK